MTPSTAPRTRESRACRPRPTSEECATAVLRSQATRSTEQMLIAAPAAESTVCAGRQVTRRRSITPTVEARNWPATAATNTTISPTIAALLPAHRRARERASWARRAPPPRNPAKDSTPMRKPCRYPEMPNNTQAASRKTSSRSPCMGISVGAAAVSAGRCAGRGLRPGSQPERLGRQLHGPFWIPRLLEPAEDEQPVEQHGGETPHQQVIESEGRPHPAAGVPDPAAVRRVDEIADRHAQDRGHLPGVARRDCGRHSPPTEHRIDHETAGRQPHRRQDGDDLHTGRIQTGLLPGLTQGRSDGPVVVL